VEVKQNYFWANKGQPTPCPLQNLIHMSSTENPTKIEENYIFRIFKQKFTTGSYGVEFERAWCCRKAWEIFIKKFLSLEAIQTANDQNLVSRNFRD
jgi:hypothetical protein